MWVFARQTPLSLEGSASPVLARGCLLAGLPIEIFMAGQGSYDPH